ncbi:BON domain-containing protein [Trinickia sp. EG282A]|uniref:BON domain-containing protein n=1 Tax=Trinickia sp. EG282A TaxID=3237013 RepID=UPI0034D2B297
MSPTTPKSRRRVGFTFALLSLLACGCARAGDPRVNRGGDPFFQISHALGRCPAPLGPLETEAEWLAQSHYRIERGNSCWWEGRCRLPNSYLYDKEIADSVKRRLSFIERSTHWKDGTTLWLTLQRRFIVVQGCVTPGFDKQAFLAELAKTADVERVIDETTSDPKAPPPYGTSADPTAPVNE